MCVGGVREKITAGSDDENKLGYLISLVSIWLGEFVIKLSHFLTLNTFLPETWYGTCTCTYMYTYTYTHPVHVHYSCTCTSQLYM